jgi:hypothetical protein
MNIFTVSPWQVIGGAVIAMALGMLWYSPFLFGKKWMELTGMSQESMNPEGSSVKKVYLISTGISLITAYVLAVIISNLVLVSVVSAIVVGFFVWLGFVATSMANEYIYGPQKKSWLLYGLHSGYHLVSLVLQAIVIFILR